MKVLVAGGGTGGHLMPALAIADALRGARRDLEVVLVGARRGIEADLLPRYSYRYYLLELEPLYRGAWWRNLRWVYRVGDVLRAVNRVVDIERPAVVVGTGGYVAGPLLWCAQRRRVPTVLQEANAFPGITTRWLARRARQVHLGFPEAASRIHAGRDTEVFAFGNPIRTQAGSADAAAARQAFGLDPARSCVFVVGGSQGARVLNGALARALEQGLLSDWSVLWGAGRAHAPALMRLAVAGRVVVRDFFDPIAEAYGASDLVVSRAGAMTVAELCALGKPSVLVPFARAAADHQTSNARALAEAGAAMLLREMDLSPESLAHAITSLLADQSRLASLASHARARGHPDAARDIASKILTLIP
ncbi:MAG TPA: undecaprenyldiphospho-muramoylpentapeptide beta-N-acetylglucosaminyltransferase [Gemmatimonadales bacterium]|nr:undecaprenyldiphospho-muramoylpentapeptide beta-N-acetylglucosaminyltransferase [Gemmatimonadales bacterium]